MCHAMVVPSKSGTAKANEHRRRQEESIGKEAETQWNVIEKGRTNGCRQTESWPRTRSILQNEWEIEDSGGRNVNANQLCQMGEGLTGGI